MAGSPAAANPVIWEGKPYILPNAIGRTITIAIITIVVLWLEFTFNVAFLATVSSIPLVAWTILVLILAWLLSIANLLLLRATNNYTLTRDGLQVRYGIITTKSFMVTPAGFSDLEVVRTLYSRIFNFGFIDIRTQGERNIRMVLVKDPVTASERIRSVMSRQTVRVETDEDIMKK